MLGPDSIVSQVFTILNTSPTKPVGLDVRDHDLLPTEPDELPVCGVYLVEDQKTGDGETMGAEHARSARIRVEIRAKGEILAATQTIREWALKALLNDTGLNDQTVFDFDYQGFQPFGMASNEHLAGADLDFLATYFFKEDS